MDDYLTITAIRSQQSRVKSQGEGDSRLQTPDPRLRDDLVQRAVDRALRYLSYRPRSESEVRARLHRYGYEDDVIARTLDRLRGSGLIDDASFAAFWKENRASFTPRSSRLVAQELRQKGVSPEIIAQALETLDNEAEAYRAGYKKAHFLERADYYGFRKKLSAFLHRRGFDYEVIRLVVERLWQEKEGDSRSVVGVVPDPDGESENE
ncbi:MAG: Regulatory protein RecX [Dehalococcoidia bacterium]|nr:Regulatory protein RecX [Chloroflexota bacterium]